MGTSDPRRWAALREEFEAIVELPPVDRPARLAACTARDAALGAELAELLELDRAEPARDRLTARLEQAVGHLALEVGSIASEGVPAWIGDYRIVGTVGSGGMGVVYRAEQQSPRRVVALKVIRGVGGDAAVRRFRREAELHGRLQHPNIALVHEAGVAPARSETGEALGPPRPYFAMEFVEGLPIVDFVRARGLDTAARVELLARVADAIDHAHARDVIHRDLKSANILVDDQGQPKVLDFGIARALDRDQAATLETAVGEVIGTLPYMSPEQVSGAPDEVGVRSDVYALGVVLFEVLTGRRPIDLAGRSLPEAVRLVVDEEPTRLSSIDRALRGDLDTIAARCLEKTPERRYAGAGALAADLRRHLAHQPIEARPASTIYQIRKFTRRHRPLVIGVATAFVALLAATIVSAVMAVRAHRAQTELEGQLRYAQSENARSTHSFEFLRNLLTAADPAISGGKPMTVTDLLLIGADAFEKNAAGESQVAGQIGQLIGYTLFRLGEQERAVRVYRRAVELLRLEDANAVSAPWILTEALGYFGDIAREAGHLDEAQAALTEAIERKKARFVELARLEFEKSGIVEDPDEYVDRQLGVAVGNLALLHRQRGDFADAEKMGARAIEINEEIFRNKHLPEWQLSINRVNQAAVFVQCGRPREAEPLLRAAVAVADRELGLEHPLSHTFRSNLASCCAALGKFDEAIELMRGVVAYRERTQPAGHFERSRALSNMGLALHAAGRSLEGLPWVRRAVEESRAANAEGQELGYTLVVEGSILLAIGELDAAERALNEAHALLSERMRPGTPRLTEAAACLARIARLEGRAEEARSIAQKALDLALASQAPNAPSTAHVRRELVLASLAAASRGAGPGSRARLFEQLDEIVAEVRSWQGADHVNTGHALLAAAEVRFDEGDFDGAAGRAEEAAPILDAPGAPRWPSDYATLLAERAQSMSGRAADPGDSNGPSRSSDPDDPDSTWARRVDAVRSAIVESLGAKSPELERLERVERLSRRPERAP